MLQMIFHFATVNFKISGGKKKSCMDSGIIRVRAGSGFLDGQDRIRIVSKVRSGSTFLTVGSGSGFLEVRNRIGFS